MNKSVDRPVTAAKWPGIPCFWLSVGGFFVMAASIMLMPCMSVLPGLLFWSGLITGIVTQAVLEKRRKQFFRDHRSSRKKYQQDRCGLISFFTTKEAAVMDVLLLLSGLSFAVCCLITKGVGYICFILAALTVFSFCMHCVLNGRNYYHIKNADDILDSLKQRKSHISTKGERSK